MYEAENLSIKPHIYRCNAEEVNSYIEYKWIISNGILNYIGEWHTHNCDNPVPSKKDILMLKETLSRDINLFKIYLIIIGKKSMYIGEATKQNQVLTEVRRQFYEEND